MFKKIFVATVALLTLSFSQAKYDAQEYVLKNGLRVVFIKKAPSTVAYFSVWYKCGSNKDHIGKSGVAHFLEHMAFETDNHKFRNFLEKIGADFNAFTSYEVVCFHETFEKSYIEEIIKNEAQRLRGITINDEDFNSEKGAILQERNERVSDESGGIWQEACCANIFNRQAGGTSIVGWKHEIESIEKEDLYEFYDKWFVPNNATIIVIGDINFSDLKKMIDKYFQDIPGKKLPPSKAELFDSSKKYDVRYYKKMGMLTTRSILYNVPKDLTFREKQALRLSIGALNHPSSEISKISDYRLGFFYSSEGFSTDYVSVICESLINDLDEMEMLWRYFRSKIISIGIRQKDIDVKKKKYLADVALHFQDDISVLGRVIGHQLVRGDSLKDATSLFDVVQSISLKECQDVLKKVFSKQPIAFEQILLKGLDRE